MRTISQPICLALCLLLTRAAVAQTVTLIPANQPGTNATAPPQPGGAAAPERSLTNVLRWSFDTDGVGTLPLGAAILLGKWEVRSEPGTPSPPNALCQVGEGEFPSCTLSPNIYSNVSVTASFKIRKDHGVSSPTAGLIVRMRDKNHYYCVRVNANEGGGNMNIYKYWLGQRNLIKHTNWPMQKDRWYVFRVEAEGDVIRGYLDGRLVAQTTDRTYSSGKVGLWVKFDTFACFDDITAGELLPAVTQGAK